jgi:nucleoid DNA-binding protein
MSRKRYKRSVRRHPPAPVLTHSILTKNIARALNVSDVRAKGMLRVVLNELRLGIARNQRVHILHFGIWQCVIREERLGGNFTPGGTRTQRALRKVKFKPSPKFCSAVNTGEKS